MSKKIYTQTPPNYPVCACSDCQQAATCLHHLAYAPLLKSSKYLHIVNPTMCKKDGGCTYYRDSQPVIYARGFASFRDNMYPKQYRAFMDLCMKKFSRNSYFERRRGDYPISPTEQEFILDALKKVGVAEELKFDQYEPLTNWYD